MRKEIRNHHKTIRAFAPEDFDRQIEEIIQEPHLLSYRLTYRGDDFTACIEYQTEETIFENIRDEYIARGEIYYCEDCPFIDPVTDRRYHYRTCKCGTTKSKGAACLYFYEQLAKGEIVMKEVQR